MLFLFESSIFMLSSYCLTESAKSFRPSPDSPMLLSPGRVSTNSCMDLRDGFSSETFGRGWSYPCRSRRAKFRSCIRLSFTPTVTRTAGQARASRAVPLTPFSVNFLSYGILTPRFRSHDGGVCIVEEGSSSDKPRRWKRS